MDVTKDLDCQYVEENDLVSSYLGGRLSEEEAEAFERHYFGCERCWAEVKAGQEIRAALKGGRATAAEARPSNVRQGPWKNWRLPAIAAALGAAVAGSVLVVRGADKKGIATLARAAGSMRTTEARLTGQFEYGPITRGADSKTGIPRKLRSAVGSATSEVGEWLDKHPSTDKRPSSERRPSVDDSHTAGVAYLLLGEWDDAIRALTEARNDASEDARNLSGLAAAYHSRAVHLGTAEDLGWALETASKAASYDPRLASAQYNLALTLRASDTRRRARSLAGLSE